MYTLVFFSPTLSLPIWETSNREPPSLNREPRTRSSSTSRWPNEHKTSANPFPLSTSASDVPSLSQKDESTRGRCSLWPDVPLLSRRCAIYNAVLQRLKKLRQSGSVSQPRFVLATDRPLSSPETKYFWGQVRRTVHCVWPPQISANYTRACFPLLRPSDQGSVRHCRTRMGTRPKSEDLLTLTRI